MNLNFSGEPIIGRLSAAGVGSAKFGAISTAAELNNANLHRLATYSPANFNPGTSSAQPVLGLAY
jgi:hypothetical protein